MWDFFCNFAFAFFEEAIAIYRGIETIEVIGIIEI